MSKARSGGVKPAMKWRCKILPVLFLLLQTVTSTGQEYKLKQTLEGHHGSITALVHSAINQALVAGDEEGYYYLYDAVSGAPVKQFKGHAKACLLYTSDAADERSSVDLGGRRIIKK